MTSTSGRTLDTNALRWRGESRLVARPSQDSTWTLSTSKSAGTDVTSMTSVVPSEGGGGGQEFVQAPPHPIATPAPPRSANPTASHTSVFLFLLAFRLLNALLVRTFFQPDEHYQATEVAHHAVFGYGWRTWEWMSDEARGGEIRGFLHPAIFAALMWIVRLLRMDAPIILATAPRLLQAVFAACSDLSVYKLSDRLVGSQAGCMTLHCLLFNTWLLYTSCRTFSNTLEAQMISMALLNWPLSLPASSEEMFPNASAIEPIDQSMLETLNRSIISSRKLSLALFFAALSIAVRPTAIIVWSFLGIKLICDQVASARRCSTTLEVLESVFSLAVIVVCVPTSLIPSFSFFTLLDSIYYGRFIFVPYEFMKRNVGSAGVSVFYGSSPWHFYLSSVLPLLGLTTLPYMLRGLYMALTCSTRSHQTPTPAGMNAAANNGARDVAALKTLAFLTVWTIFAYSLLGHKEQRFLQPVAAITLPIFGGLALSSPRGGMPHTNVGTVEPQLQPEAPAPAPAALAGAPCVVSQAIGHLTLFSKQLWTSFASLKRSHKWAQIALLAHLVPSIYLLRYHCIAQEQIPRRISQLADKESFKSIALLMPCHSTPWQSIMHRQDLSIFSALGSDSGEGKGGRAWALTCEPPPIGADSSSYVDQSDVFYADPLAYLRNRFPASVDARFQPSAIGAAESAAFMPLWEALQLRRSADTPQGVPLSVRVDKSASPLHTWPSHLAIFSNLLTVASPTSAKSGRPSAPTDTVGAYLEALGYVEVERHFNSLFHDDHRRSGDVVILQWQGSS
ncbi:hypothetical protein IE81DRAFT_367251 [Ceraceosorus guamensis]|uniref:Mannosyltransferase n=1 Tax=Ceraceosorus guamensis TaxID=1522189 RepID=A0A316VWF0_9BASI|nr:hypothetical protein IE81DRAFT_367251 [Ceraceosorus guamensis]PWN41769.1 hypothetical protein IE81DRAFT_367251 [Ceraceosorus guamensis]